MSQNLFSICYLIKKQCSRIKNRNLNLKIIQLAIWRLLKIQILSILVLDSEREKMDACSALTNTHFPSPSDVLLLPICAVVLALTCTQQLATLPATVLQTP